MGTASEAEAKKANQLRQTLYWAGGTLVAALALWQIGDPWLVKHFGSGAPWWAYLLLCMRLVGGIIKMVVADAALRAAGEEDPSNIGPAKPKAPSAWSESLSRWR